MQLLLISKDSCSSEEKDDVITIKGVVYVTGFIRLYVLAKAKAGREVQFLEVMWTNVLANEVVRHFFNLTAKG